LVEGFTFQKIDNSLQVADIVEAWRRAKPTQFRMDLSRNFKKRRSDALEASTAKHAELVKAQLKTWLKDLVPGMKLTAVYAVVRLGYCGPAP
jgi:hypothetical protein